MNFPRETATRLEDMPHAYDVASAGHSCSLCGADERDPRHASWQRMELASRETAEQQRRNDARELGS